MITFYADSIKDAYEKIQNDEWKSDIQDYINDLNGFVDGQKLDTHNLLSLFELDAYDIYITWEDVTYQTSRLAMAFRRYILDQYGSMNIVINTPLNSANEELLSNPFICNLKKLRKMKNLTQKELSTISNIPLNTIINYENEQRSPTGKNLCKLAIALKVNPLELLGTDID